MGELTENFWADTSINRAIQEAERRFCYEERWPWLLRLVTPFAVTASTATITLPTNVDMNRAIRVQMTPSDSRIRVLKRVNPINGLNLEADYSGSVSGLEPLYFYVSNMVSGAYLLHLVPAADKAYTATYAYFAVPAVLTTDDDTPLTPDQYQMALVHYATAQMWRKEINGDTKADKEIEEYRKIVDDARKDFDDLPEDKLLVWGGESPEYRPISQQDFLNIHVPGPF